MSEQLALHNITNLALEQWIKVTGVDPSKKRKSWTYGEYSIREINEYIMSAQRVDDTGLTAFMVVRAVARQYVSEHQLDALSIIEADEATLEQIEGFKELLKLVNNKEALAAVSDFQDHLRKAAAHYGVAEKCEETITDMAALAYIRRDALVCPELLNLNTFKKGARSKGQLKYNEHILQFWNMNSLVRGAESQPVDGISIVMILDPQVIEYSFFCFLVRDGENISIWTDAEKGAHPMQKHMSRSRGRGRQLEERADRLRFPYQMLKVKVSEKGDPIKIQGTEIVRTNVDATPIAPFSEMEPDQLLWAIMALDVLRKEKHSEKLSVTGEGMVALPPGASKVLPPGFGEAIALTSEVVTSKAMEDQLAQAEHRSFKSTGVNNWMEERYGDQVDNRLLNLVEVQTDDDGEEEDFFSRRDRKGWRNKDITALVTTGRDKLDYKKVLPKSKGVVHKNAHLGSALPDTPTLIGIDPIAFGTPEEMEEDRLWVARWNQAQALAMAAQAEFERRHKEVSAWYAKAVKTNADAIIEAAVRGSWTEEFGRSLAQFAHEPETRSNLIRFHRKARGRAYEWPFGYYSMGAKDGVVNLARLPKDGCLTSSNPARSFLSEDRANIFVCFEPKTAVGIAMLAGCEVKDLPEPLEHWLREPPYDGNSILSRTDPLDSQVGNPWRQFPFDVRLALSKRDWNKLVKEAGDKAGKITWQVRSKRGDYWIRENEADD